MERKDLRSLPREELLRLATDRGVVRPESLSTDELINALVAPPAADPLPAPPPAPRAPPPPAPISGPGARGPRGWFTRARDLLTSVLETGFPPPASARAPSSPPSRPPQASLPLPTVTLAEIYAAQGHFERAIATLNEVLQKEPAHAEAERLKQRFAEQLVKTRPSAPPPPDDTAETSTLTRPSEPEAPDVAPAAAADDDAPGAPEGLPDHYEVDEVVGLAVDARTVYVYWEVRPLTLAGARRRAADGRLTLRVLAVTSSQAGPIASTRDERVDALFGEMYVHDLPAGSNVRLTVGWLDASGHFDPLAVALDLQTPHVEPSRRAAGRTAAWTRDVPLLDDEAAATFTAPLRFDRPVYGSALSAPLHGGAVVYPSSDAERPGPGLSPSPTAARRGRVGSSDLFRKDMRFGASDQLRGPRSPV